MDINATVDILVKTPLLTDKVGDETVQAPLSWNVRQLKEHLARVIPKNPSPESQKLILSGKILSDSAVLRECFSSVPTGSLPILHLVWRPTNSAPSTTLSTSPTVENEGLRQRTQAPHSNEGNAFGSYAAPASFAGAFTPDQVQMAQYFQMYNAYMQQYYYSQMPMFSHGLSQQVPASPVAPAVAPIPPVNNPPVEAQRVPQVVMNAAQGGNVINEDELGRRDAFDWFYTCFRLVALIAAVYVSSSSSRFFSVFSMISIFLLFNTIRDFVQWRARHERQQREAAAVDGQVNQPERANQAEGENVAANGEPEVVAPPVNPSLLSTVMNVAIGFITSLVPENVAHILN